MYRLLSVGEVLAHGLLVDGAVVALVVEGDVRARGGARTHQAHQHPLVNFSCHR